MLLKKGARFWIHCTWESKWELYHYAMCFFFLLYFLTVFLNFRTVMFPWHEIACHLHFDYSLDCDTLEEDFAISLGECMNIFLFCHGSGNYLGRCFSFCFFTVNAWHNLNSNKPLYREVPDGNRQSLGLRDCIKKTKKELTLL